MQLRKCCAHPDLLTQPEQMGDEDKFIAASGKLALLDTMVSLHSGTFRQSLSLSEQSYPAQGDPDLRSDILLCRHLPLSQHRCQ